MKLLASTAALILAGATAQAATLTLPVDANGSVIETDFARLMNEEGLLYAFDTMFFGYVGGYRASDFSLTFFKPVKNVMVETAGWTPGIDVNLSGYNNGTFVGEIAIDLEGSLDLSSFGIITSLFFDYLDPQDPALVFDQLTYDLVETEPTPDPVPAPVPVPASLPLLAGALAGIAALRRRKA